MHAVRTERATGRRASRALAVVALVPTFALLLATGASAAVTAVSGGAFGVSATIDVPLGADVTVGPSPTVTLPPGGSLTTAVVNSPGLLRTEVLTVSSQGTTGPTGSVTSSASVDRTRVGATGAPVLQADVISSTCTSTEAGSTGSSSVTNLRLLGAVVDVTSVPATGLTVAGVGTLFVNEQIRTGTGASTGITVNALRLELNVPLLGTGTIIIAQSRCAVVGDGVVVPTGAVGGVLLTGVVAVLFGGYQLVRRNGRGRRRFAA